MLQVGEGYQSYQGSNGVVLAMARNEVAGICQTVTAFAQSAQNMLDDGTVRLLFTTERERVPRLNVPTIFFTKGGNPWLREMMESGASAIGLDWTSDPRADAIAGR